MSTGASVAPSGPRVWGTPAQSGAPDGEALHARLRRMSDREMEQEIARLEADAGRGQVVV